VSPFGLLRFIVYALAHGMLRSTPISEVATFGDGATLDIPGAPRVIHVPGHSPGSAVLHISSRDALFVGDALCTMNVLTGKPGPGRAPCRAASGPRSRRGTRATRGRRRGSGSWRR